MDNTREIVLDTLLAIESGQGYSHKIIKDVLDKYNYLGGQEKAFIKRLTEGTTERQIELDYVLNGISSVPVKKMKPLIRSLLRMGVYQILYMDGVPDSAACNEAVKLAEKRKFHNLKGFVNGVLRKVSAVKGSLSYPDAEKQPVEFLSVKYSMPAWLVELWISQYGREKTVQMLSGLLQARPVTIRLAAALTEEARTALVEAMEQRGVQVRQHPYLSYAYELSGVEGVAALPGYEEGSFAVQDVSSMLAVEAAGIREGDFVLDVCAAPGGKSMLAAEKAGETGRVQARDVSEHKVSLIEENLERMGLTNVTCKVWDATVCDTHTALYEGGTEGPADVVLVDVPCSGLGVMGKKRDIKYHVAPQRLKDITELQRQILAAVNGYVREGGTLLYSTCTVRKEENEDMVKWICDNFPFVPEDMSCYMPKQLQEDTAVSGYLQLFPGIHDTDGFFMARLKRVRRNDGCRDK